MSTPTSSVFSDLKSESPTLLASCMPSLLRRRRVFSEVLGEGVLACCTPGPGPSQGSPPVAASYFLPCSIPLLLCQWLVGPQPASAPGPFHASVPSTSKCCFPRATLLTSSKFQPKVTYSVRPFVSTLFKVTSLKHGSELSHLPFLLVGIPKNF